MMIESKSWYALINGKLYAFQSRHQRDIAGGEPLTQQEAHPYLPNVKNIPFQEFNQWYETHRKSHNKPLR